MVLGAEKGFLQIKSNPNMIRDLFTLGQQGIKLLHNQELPPPRIIRRCQKELKKTVDFCFNSFFKAAEENKAFFCQTPLKKTENDLMYGVKDRIRRLSRQ